MPTRAPGHTPDPRKSSPRAIDVPDSVDVHEGRSADCPPRRRDEACNALNEGRSEPAFGGALAMLLWDARYGASIWVVLGRLELLCLLGVGHGATLWL
jgi:hypothetical protein